MNFHRRTQAYTSTFDKPSTSLKLASACYWESPDDRVFSIKLSSHSRTRSHGFLEELLEFSLSLLQRSCTPTWYASTHTLVCPPQTSISNFPCGCSIGSDQQLSFSYRQTLFGLCSVELDTSGLPAESGSFLCFKGFS